MIVFIEAGRKRKGEIAECKHCTAPFHRRLNPIGGVQKHFCKRSCALAFKAAENCVECSLCQTKIHRSPSKRRNSKHGFYFCSRTCKELAQSLGGPFKSMQPDHYGTGDGKQTYRTLAFKHLPIKCKDCGIDFWPLLTVHHKDRNRANNKVSNLEILCYNHHVIRHLKKKVMDGVVTWTRSTQTITKKKDVLMLMDFIKQRLAQAA